MAEEAGWVKGLSICREGPSLSHVQYADDTVILCAAEETSVRGVKFVCQCFELLSGLHINFHKSAMLGINLSEGVLSDFARIMGCLVDSFPAQHLGLPLHLGKLKSEDWAPLVQRFERRLEGWQCRVLSFGARITLHQMKQFGVHNHVRGSRSEVVTVG
ncbi:hypothetical protein QJS04_geneDACA020304 [Acorus gramineus]|uniref:Reverse transcriptase n=1 Tax=Acorus gramineus TaxID=55184 RepID=A0AAV9AA75_ACOGR|nr:hypothetical protein QJS04_geneDACA020304 [Acorus gramineus]